MHAIPTIPRTSKGPKSKLSQSQSSAKQGAATKSKKAATTHISDSVSVKSGTTNKSTKKKKKLGHKHGDDKSDAGSDSARTQIISPAPVVEEKKVEEPKTPERPKKTFIQPEKITLMD